MNDEVEVDLMDLGDAMVETKQIAPAPIVPDSWYGWGWPV